MNFVRIDSFHATKWEELFMVEGTHLAYDDVGIRCRPVV